MAKKDRITVLKGRDAIDQLDTNVFQKSLVTDTSIDQSNSNVCV